MIRDSVKMERIRRFVREDPVSGRRGARSLEEPGWRSIASVLEASSRAVAVSSASLGRRQ